MNSHTRPALSVLYAVGICFLCYFLLFALQSIGIYLASLMYYLQSGNLDFITLITLGSENGMVVAMSILFTAVAFGLICYAIGFFSQKIINRTHPNLASTSHFFAIKPLKISDIASCLLILLVFLVVSEALTVLLKQDPMVFMDSLLTSESFYWLIFAVVVAAPIYEELVFRGVVFGVIEHSVRQKNLSILGQNFHLNTLIASLVSSFIFALIHLQYNFFGMATIFCMALIFCYARAKHGLGMAILLHLANNVIAMGLYFFRQY